MNVVKNSTVKEVAIPLILSVTFFLVLLSNPEFNNKMLWPAAVVCILLYMAAMLLGLLLLLLKVSGTTIKNHFARQIAMINFGLSLSWLILYFISLETLELVLGIAPFLIALLLWRSSYKKQTPGQTNQ